ncbi:DUF805 domain-containing protein [Rhodoferax sp. BAB1]|uniref:DUF805 domain-containing protein n=1 Tax=Rhodoferax sp. BAB1 TaxID=2741720 RepID=UPI0015770BB2|nr:DUF805 domain-containing protein [Rhodoferax sp. BAB1]QKO21165.1 DUF805 domain-containing protein [Rhodoferax sp. BAB1]
MSWFFLALQKYAVFSGRSRRSEYWYFMLFYLLIFVALVFLDNGLGTYNRKSDVGLFSTLYALLMLLPSFAVAARRLHDMGKSGWWQLIAIIPFIGGLVLIAFLIRDSQAGQNKYGPNPKAAA